MLVFSQSNPSIIYIVLFNINNTRVNDFVKLFSLIYMNQYFVKLFSLMIVFIMF